MSNMNSTNPTFGISVEDDEDAEEVDDDDEGDLPGM